MSLMPTMNLGLARPSVVVSLNHVEGYDAISDAGDEIRIGGLVRHTAIASDARRRSPPLSKYVWLLTRCTRSTCSSMESMTVRWWIPYSAA